MKSRRLGKTRHSVSEIGFGGWAVGGDAFGNAYGPTDDAVSRAAIRKALELGVTFFDTADLYGHGHGEALLGEVLSAWPGGEKIVVATKGGVNFYRGDEVPTPEFTPYALTYAVERSRDRLRRDRLDVFLLMNPPLEVLTESEIVWDTLMALRRAGKIDAIGVSITEADEGVALLERNAPVDVLEVTYNLFYQSAALTLLPMARKKRVGIIAREPLANGFLTGKYEANTSFPDSDIRSALMPEYVAAMTETAESLKFLTHPNRTLAQAALRFVLDAVGVSVAIPGAKTPEQVAENVAAAASPPLTDDERAAIHRVFFPEPSLPKREEQDNFMRLIHETWKRLNSHPAPPASGGGEGSESEALTTS